MIRIFYFHFFVFIFIAAAEDWTLPAEQVVLKPNPGADLVKANCLMCHSVDYITTQPSLTRDQWKASVTKMQQKYGAPVVAESVDPLLDYLLRSYGKPATP
ncbi:MAG: cytochrome c [Chthoniobacteraceae bacterium]